MLVNIPYLEGQDINQDGSLKGIVIEKSKGRPIVMMVQGNFCGYCTKAKPDFSQFAKQTPGVFVVTVQTDGSDSDRAAAKNLSAVNKAPGVPSFLGFDKNGKFKSIHNGGRDVASLQAFAKSL